MAGVQPAISADGSVTAPNARIFAFAATPATTVGQGVDVSVTAFTAAGFALAFGPTVAIVNNIGGGGGRTGSIRPSGHVQVVPYSPPLITERLIAPARAFCAARPAAVTSVDGWVVEEEEVELLLALA